MDDFLLFIVCVIYNKKIEEIVSYNQFIDSSRNKCVRFLVVDNSSQNDICISNKEMNKDFTYLCSNGNVGLSRAYNTALKYIDNYSYPLDKIWVMIADDDTYISQDYINNLLNTIGKISISKEDCSLISTNIKTDVGCMSPFTIKGIRINAFEGKTGKCYSNVYAINSGLCIKRNLLKIIGDYDEDLFLDYVDIYFFDRVKMIKKDNLLLIDGEIRQKFSAMQSNNFEKNNIRYKIFKKDFSYYCKATKKSKLFWLYILAKRRLNILRNL